MPKSVSEVLAADPDEPLAHLWAGIEPCPMWRRMVMHDIDMSSEASSMGGTRTWSAVWGLLAALLLRWRREGSDGPWVGQVVYAAELRPCEWSVVIEWLTEDLLTALPPA